MLMRIAVALFLILGTSFAHADVEIAVVGPMSGSEAAFGDQMKHGAEIAVQEINARGGLNGQKIKMTVEDDGCDPKQATAVANRIAARGIKYVIGHWCSGTTLAAVPIYAEEGILEIDPAGLLPETTQKGVTTLYRLSGTTRQWGSAMASYVLKALHPKRIFLMIDERAASRMIGEAFMRDVKQKNALVELRVDYYSPGTRDFSAVLSRVKEFAPDVLVVPGYTLETSMLVRQAQAAGVAKHYYGMDTMGSPDFARTVGMKQSEEIAFLDYTKPKNSSQLQNLNTALEKNNWPKETYIYMTYAALEIFEQAWPFLEKTTPREASLPMHQKTYQTILGEVRFLPNGDNATARFSTYQWKDFKPVEVNFVH